MFKPIVKKVKIGTINKVILAVSVDKKVAPELLDFEILKINTYYKIIQKTSWKQVPKEQLKKLFEPKNLINHTILITQDYHIKIYHKERQKTGFKPNIALGINKNRTLAKAVVKADSKFGTIDSKFQLNLYHEINKKKLKAGLLIGVMDNELIRGIKELLKKIVKEKGLKEDFNLIAAKGINPINGTPDKVELLYLEKNINSERNFVDPVESDELIAVYTKPVPSTCGRGCDGEIIYPEKIEKLYPNGISCDDTIVAKEDKESISFYALRGGYVSEIDGRLSIQNEVSLKEASFKGSGSIFGGDEKNINVNISENDSSRDAISSGVKLDVANVDVAGSVGDNTKINATAVKIGSQTHKNSIIEAGDKAEVHLHRGDLTTKEADINTLETGKITADIAKIKKALGGEIYAKDVIIDELVSNVKIVASMSVTINKITGEGNKIKISAEAIDDDHKIEQIKQNIKDQKQSIIELEENKKSLEKKLVDEAPRRMKFQKQLVQFQKANKKPPVATMAKIREYLRYEEEIKNFDSNLQDILDSIQKLKDELHDISQAAFKAVVNMNGIWDGHTEIVFIHPETSEEFRLVPTANETNIMLKDLGDGQAEIVFE